MERSSPDAEPSVADTAPRRPWLSLRGRRLAAVLLFVFGLQLWLLVDQRLVRRPFELITVLSLVVASLLPPVQRVVAVALDWLRTRNKLAVVAIALLLWAGSCAYFYATAARQQRAFALLYQDEFSYQIQAQMLARGRLWMPKHPLADFFDSFYVIVDPVYSSMYFPGTAMLLTPGVWLGLPTWMMPLLLSGGAVAMAFRLFRELIDGAAGLVAAVMFVGLSLLRMLSVMSLSAVPALLLGMLVVYAWLRWRRQRGSGWLVVLGIASGWLAITRPVDALCYCVPTWLLLMFDLRRERFTATLRAVSLLVASAAPLLAIQLVFNRGVTGRWLTTPFSFYTQRDYPNVSLGFGSYDPSATPASSIPQKREYYEKSVKEMLRQHTAGNVAQDWATRRYRTLLRESLPDPLLVVLVPMGLLGLTRRRHAVLLLAVPLFAVFYSLYPFFIVHYVIIVAPAVILLALLAWTQVPALWPRAGRPLATMGALILVGLTVLSLPEFHRTAADEFFKSPVHPHVNALLASLPHQPAVVLFKYAPGQSLEEEPVYNAGVAWPDDAKVIRAHDLGDRNAEIFKYYAQREPDRAFYRYDRLDGSLNFLGFARDLASVPLAVPQGAGADRL